MSTNQPYEEKELLARAAAGDAAAFEQLYLQYRPKSFSVILSYVKFEADAEDILQDIFVQLWLSRHKLATVQDFDAYLFITVRNAITLALRRQERQQRLKVRSQPVLAAEAPSQVKDIESLVENALEQLSNQQQTMYRMSRRDGLTHEQIAVSLGLSPKTVANTITLVLNHIRQFLAQHGYMVAATWMLLLP